MDDKQFMALALKEARSASKKDNYPVGAVIVADGKVVAKSSNSVQQNKDSISHAELTAIHKSSAKIKKLIKSGKPVTLYTTLEPCLMCLGTAILHRISRIVYACPDPHGGATKLDPRTASEWYVRKWPIISKGAYEKESYDLVTAFMRKHPENWSKVLAVYEKQQ